MVPKPHHCVNSRSKLQFHADSIRALFKQQHPLLLKPLQLTAFTAAHMPHTHMGVFKKDFLLGLNRLS